ncbi:MAG: hypothetical protein FJW23_10860, partial [Acidimicrobiia bacterium]|nr:hypothetical protein [Acidimicrobiia bacterium]
MRRMIGGVVGLVTVAVAVGAWSLQGRAADGTLTPADHVEIRDLYNRYNHYIDNVKDNGYAYAGLFTEDGVFETNIAVGTRTGREALA